MSNQLKIIYDDVDALILDGSSARRIHRRRQIRQIVDRLIPAVDPNAPILTDPRSAVGVHSSPFLGKEIALLAAETGGVGAAGSRASWTSISWSRVSQPFIAGFAAHLLTFNRHVEAAHHV